MPDLLTLVVELAGLVIFCIWIVIPLREFRTIAHRLRQRAAPPHRP